MTSADVSAQSTQSWTGSTPEEALDKTVFLYNVGTGRFMVHGGDWGTQARVFEKDYGKSMTLVKNDNRYVFKTGVNTGDAAVLGCNVPLVSSYYDWKGHDDDNTWNVIMDANEHWTQYDSGAGWPNNDHLEGYRGWVFIPAGNGAYYIYEEMGGKTSTTYYITYTSDNTTYYMKNDGTFTSTKTDGQAWSLVNNYIGYTNGNTTYYLKYASSGINVTPGTTSGNLAVFSNGYIVLADYTTYFLKYPTTSGGSASWARGTSNRATYISESETSGGTNYWMGAAYGENGPANATPGDGHEGDPVGKLALLASGYDKVVWSTADPRTDTEYPCQLKSAETAYLSYDDEDNKTVNRSMQTSVRVFNDDTYIPLNDLYKWKIITEEEFMSTLKMTDMGDGLETNLTWQITDRGFERNDNNFFSDDIGWKTGRVTGVTYGNTSTGRHGYTWGYVSQGNLQSEYNDGPWNAPVRLKAQWSDKNNAKYGFMEFEGAGTASTYVDVTTDGVYRISCYGFYQGTNPGYLFATTTNPQGTTPVNPSNFKTANLKQVSTAPYRNADKATSGSATRSTSGGTTTYSGSGVMFAGATFLNDFPTRKEFYREVQITITGATGTSPKRIYLGVGKNGATQSGSHNGYYHDTEYVGVDQFNIQYLGTDEPITFDESKEDWTYLPEGGNDRQRSIRLKRAFKTDKWNSFVFPYNLTSTQVRNAFGDGTRVAKLDGLGTITNDANIIDFASVSLPEGTGIAIEANKFYLIKPSDPLPDTKDYYDMGTQVYKYSELPQGVQTAHYDIGENAAHASGHNTIISKATYWATTNYANFNRNNLTAVTNGIYAPAKSYVISDSQMYYIKNPNRIKGFRGWIEDVDAATGTTGGAKLALNGVFDENEISGINAIFTEEVIVPSNGSIYDLSGRKVAGNASQLNALPKGMYIVNGKKYIVK